MATINLSRLLRRAFNPTECLARKMKPRLKEQTILERKEAKRLANANPWTTDNTNQRVPQDYDGHDVKTIGLYIQSTQNAHPLSFPLSPQLKKQIIRTQSQNAHYLYYKFRNNLLAEKQYRDSVIQSKIDQEVQTMPASFRNPIVQRSRQYLMVPTILHEQIAYLQQFQVVLPKDQYQRKIIVAQVLKSYLVQSKETQKKDDDFDDKDESSDDEFVM